MNRFGFVFPGQGTQYVGMGKKLYEQFEGSREIYEEANDVLGFDIADLCFNGSIGDLSKTENAQLALLTTSVAAYKAYEEVIGWSPLVGAGHSLGEYSALVCAGAIQFSDALMILRHRGQLVEEFMKKGNGAMSVLDGIEKEIVEKLCQNQHGNNRLVTPACYNSPLQTVVSGEPDAVMLLEQEVEQLGGTFTPFLVNAPFHSPMMQEVAEHLKLQLSRYSYAPCKWTVLSNVTALPYEEAQVVELLTRQMTQPVQWKTIVDRMLDFKIDALIEMGPQAVLTNLAKGYVHGINGYSFGQKDDRDVLISSVEKQKSATSFFTKCLTAVVCTPNENWDVEEFKKGVEEPYEKIEQMEKFFEENKIAPDIKQLEEALLTLRSIFQVKKVPLEEQRQWINEILDETQTGEYFRNIDLGMEVGA
nr:ACP S-malonyltransferase [Paenibacillus xylanexedens]